MIWNRIENDVPRRKKLLVWGRLEGDITSTRAPKRAHHIVVYIWFENENNSWCGYSDLGWGYEVIYDITHWAELPKGP